MELISVIVLTYNSEKTVVETLDSIQKQSYSNLEIVVSDDNSTDDTVNVVKKWFLDNNIKWKIVTSSKNQGIPSNYNKGIKAATGELIKGIAGDDILFPNAILSFYNSYKSNPHCIFVSKCLYFEDNIKNVNKSQKGTDYYFYTLSPKEQYKLLCNINKVNAPGIGLINKSIFDKYGYFDESYPLLEDYPFNLKMTQNGVPFRLIEDYLVGYRIKNTSVSNNNSLLYYKCEQKLFFKKRALELFISFKYKSLFIQFVKYFLVIFHWSIKRDDKGLVFFKLR